MPSLMYKIKFIAKFIFEIWGILRDLVPFAQFKNVKYTHGRVLLLVKVQAEALNLIKSNTPLTLLHGCFLRFFNYKNGTKLNKASHIVNSLFAITSGMPTWNDWTDL